VGTGSRLNPTFLKQIWIEPANPKKSGKSFLWKNLYQLWLSTSGARRPLAARPGTPLMILNTDLGLSIRISMFEHVCEHTFVVFHHKVIKSHEFNVYGLELGFKVSSSSFRVSALGVRGSILCANSQNSL